MSIALGAGGQWGASALGPLKQISVARKWEINFRVKRHQKYVIYIYSYAYFVTVNLIKHCSDHQVGLFYTNHPACMDIKHLVDITCARHFTVHL